MKNKKFITILFVLVILIITKQARSESLASAVFRAIASNPEVRAEINRKSAQQKILRQAQAGYYPSVDLYASVGNENSDNRFTRAIGETGYVNLTRKEENFVVTQNIFKGFSTSSEVKKNLEKVTAANNRLHEVTEQIALQVAGAYLDTLKQKGFLAISQNNLNLHVTLFNKVQSRSRSGLGRRADIDQAMGRVALARANLLADESNLQNAYVKFQRVVGAMPQNLVNPPDQSRILPDSVESVLKKAMEYNPLIKAAEAEVNAALAQRQVARGGYYPSLDLVFTQSRGENLDGIVGVDKDYSLMLKMRYNLFGGGYDSSRVDEASYRINESKENLDDVRRQVTETTRLAWNAYQSINQQLPYLKQHVSAAEKTRDAYADQFKIGQRTLLDLLDSENELYQAKRKYIAATYDRELSIYRVLVNMGGFVETLQAAK